MTEVLSVNFYIILYLMFYTFYNRRSVFYYTIRFFLILFLLEVSCLRERSLASLLKPIIFSYCSLFYMIVIVALW